MSLTVDEMALDELAVDEMAVGDWQPPIYRFSYSARVSVCWTVLKKACKGQNTLAYYEKS